jgi:hypothetical protein
MDRARSTHWEKRNAYRILVGKPEVKRPLGRPRRSWMDSIVTCTVIRVTELTGSSSDDWIY